MNSKAWTAAVIALVLGIGIGYLLCTALYDGGRGKGEIPPPPSEIGQGVPPGTWSRVPCGTTEAVDMLDDLYDYAVADLQGGILPQGQFDQAYTLMCECALGNGAWSGGDPAAKCGVLDVCLPKAQQHMWGEVIQHLASAQP